MFLYLKVAEKANKFHLFIHSLSLSLFYEGVKMYNSLPANIKQSDRLKTFKHELKGYILK